MRIIDKNNDFYDYLQNMYPDRSLTFDRTDSYLLTKEIMCDRLSYSRRRYGFKWKEYEKQVFLLLQICNTFWIFLVNITKENEYNSPTDYAIELITTWKNYSRQRMVIDLNLIDLDWTVEKMLYKNPYKDRSFDMERLKERADTITQAIDSGNFKYRTSLNDYTIIKGGYGYNLVKIEKHIPLLKACGIASLIDPLDVFLSLEEYFSLEKSSIERTESVGLTDTEKIGNHGFDTKTSFRGK